MKVIITGCEYTGASTLARDFVDWLYDKYGGRGKFPPRFSVHDHFEIPDLVHAELNDSERDSMVALAPKLTEAFQRYNVLHHTPTLQSASQLSSGIMVLVGFHLAEAIYAQMYYGYGLEGELLDRRQFARRIDSEVMEFGPETIMAVLTASPDAIRQRMSSDRHPYGVVREEDVEAVLARFEEEYEASTIERKFKIDTTDMTPAQALRELVTRFESYLTDEDRRAFSQVSGD